MTLPLERAHTRRPVTWLTLIGVLLLPVLIGGILVTALYNPVERLDSIRAAIVNSDEPVTLDGQYIPLGRQLTAGLVEGSDADAEVSRESETSASHGAAAPSNGKPSNLTWTISNEQDAARGLKDGAYDAVITIPENFSAAATSTAPGGTPERATISVTTPPDSLVVDDAITAQVTQAAASLMGEQLSQVYLENVFLGFTTLGDRLTEAADGASGLADGAVQLSSAVAQLAEGASGAATGAAALPDGASALGSGASLLSGGAGELASGLDTIASGTRGVAGGLAGISTGARTSASQLSKDGIVPEDLLGLADGAAATAGTAVAEATGVADELATLVTECLDAGASRAFCAKLAAAEEKATTTMQTATNASSQSGYAAGGLRQFDTTASGEFAGQLTAMASGLDQLTTLLTQLAGGVDQSASGARGLSAGAGDLASGAGQLAAGSRELADGLGALADGTSQLTGGASELAGGTRSLADGLSTAATSVPSYTESEASDLASVVAKPMATEGISSNLFGASAIPLLATLALWFGGLASFIALRAVPRHVLSSRRTSVMLALRGLAPAAAIGAGQGLLVAGVVQLAATYDWAAWSQFALLCVVAGVAFAAVNQALVAVLGGAGRWVAALIGVLSVATGVVSTVPVFLSSLAALMPTTPAYQALLAALTPAGGAGVAIAGLVVWSLLAFVATTFALARRRSTTARAVLTASLA